MYPCHYLRLSFQFQRQFHILQTLLSDHSLGMQFLTLTQLCSRLKVGLLWTSFGALVVKFLAPQTAWKFFGTFRSLQSPQNFLNKQFAPQETLTQKIWRANVLSAGKRCRTVHCTRAGICACAMNVLLMFKRNKGSFVRPPDNLSKMS